MGARVLPAPSPGLAAPLPALRHLLAPSGAPGTEGCQTVLDAREEVRRTYPAASEKRFRKRSGYTSQCTQRKPCAFWPLGAQGLVCLNEATGDGDEGAEGNAAAPALEFTARSGGGGRVANITSSPCLI